jgi:hypothetical protein
MLGSLGQDVRFAVRSLRRGKGFTAIAIVSAGLAVERPGSPKPHVVSR